MKKENSVPPILQDAKRKPAFPDDWTKIQNINPLFPTEADFDWEGVSAALGEASEIAPDYCEQVAQALATLTEFAVFGVKPVRRGPYNLEKIGRRLLALMWTINPAWFSGISMRELSEQLKLSRGSFCRDTGDASRAFKVRNRSQSHASNFKQNPHEKN